MDRHAVHAHCVGFGAVLCSRCLRLHTSVVEQPLQYLTLDITTNSVRNQNPSFVRDPHVSGAKGTEPPPTVLVRFDTSEKGKQLQKRTNRTEILHTAKSSQTFQRKSAHCTHRQSKTTVKRCCEGQLQKGGGFRAVGRGWAGGRLEWSASCKPEASEKLTLLICNWGHRVRLK